MAIPDRDFGFHFEQFPVHHDVWQGPPPVLLGVGFATGPQEGCAKGRKMGHITVTGFTPASALEEIQPVLAAACQGHPGRCHKPGEGAQKNKRARNPGQNGVLPLRACIRDCPGVRIFFRSPEAVDGDGSIDYNSIKVPNNPSVGIIMGSDSDLPTMKASSPIVLWRSAVVRHASTCASGARTAVCFFLFFCDRS